MSALADVRVSLAAWWPASAGCDRLSAGSSPTATDPYADAQGYGMRAGDFCVLLCLNASLNWGPKGVYIGYGGGIGLRAEASVGIGGGYGVLSPTGNVSAECGGFLPWGLSAGMSFTPPGGYATTGYGADSDVRLTSVTTPKFIEEYGWRLR